MRTAMNFLIAVTLFTMSVANVTYPLTPAVASTDECDGEAPSPECECCEDCGCWVCP